MTVLISYGTVVVATGLELLLILYGIFTGNLLELRVLVGLLVLAYVIFSAALARIGRHLAAGWMMLCLYGALASGVLLLWGINTAAGILILGFVIFLAGIMLGSIYIIPVSLVVVGTITLIHFIHDFNIISPNREALSMPSHLGDIVTYGSLLGIFGLISWVATHRLNRAFRRAVVAERKVRRQKAKLARKLEVESNRLKNAQLEEIRQLYQFAEVGQSTTAILHDLANHLSILSLDIEDMAEKHQHNKTIENAQDSIRHINRLIRTSRQRIQSTQKSERFNVLRVIRQTVKDLRQSLESSGITIALDHGKQRKFIINGDSMGLSHIITILLKNARDACSEINDAKIIISIQEESGQVFIRVTDNGPGIPEKLKEHLFLPKRSSKSSGLGIGLYIAKHITETQFKGDIKLDSQNAGTSFAISLPLAP